MTNKQLSFRSPGRVNLIGDHTDYTGGLVLPMAIDRYTTISGTRTPSTIRLRSQNEPETVKFELPISSPEKVTPTWGRYVAGVAAEMQNRAQGFDGEISCTIPIGAGLSSSRNRARSRRHEHACRTRKTLPTRRTPRSRRAMRNHGSTYGHVWHPRPCFTH